MSRLSANYHINDEPNAEIRCTAVLPSPDMFRQDEYLRLKLGDVTVFPTRDQLLHLLQTVGDCLSANPEVK